MGGYQDLAFREMLREAEAVFNAVFTDELLAGIAAFYALLFLALMSIPLLSLLARLAGRGRQREEGLESPPSC